MSKLVTGTVYFVYRNTQTQKISFSECARACMQYMNLRQIIAKWSVVCLQIYIKIGNIHSLSCCLQHHIMAQTVALKTCLNLSQKKTLEDAIGAPRTSTTSQLWIQSQPTAWPFVKDHVVSVSQTDGLVNSPWLPVNRDSVWESWSILWELQVLSGAHDQNSTVVCGSWQTPTLWYTTRWFIKHCV